MKDVIVISDGDGAGPGLADYWVKNCTDIARKVSQFKTAVYREIFYINILLNPQKIDINKALLSLWEEHIFC